MKILLVLLVCCTPALAFAHPGHGTTDPGSWRHYLTEPVHVAVIASALAFVVSVVLYRRRAKACSVAG
jgi:putative copper export protein